MKTEQIVTTPRMFTDIITREESRAFLELLKPDDEKARDPANLTVDDLKKNSAILERLGNMPPGDYLALIQKHAPDLMDACSARFDVMEHARLQAHVDCMSLDKS